MKKLFLILLALSFALASQGADTYEKFTSKAGIKSAGTCMRIYKDGDKYWMEFPDSLMGRRVILSSFMRKSSGWTTCGTDISAREVFTLSKTDSLLLLTSPVAGPESTIAPVRYAFPIKYRNADSTAVVVEVSKLFNPSNKDAFNPAKVQVDGNAMVDKATVKPEFTYFKELLSYPSSTGVLQGVSFKVAPAYDLGGGMLQVVKEEILSVDGEVATLLTLVPESTVKVRVADPRIGTVNASRNVISSDKGIKKEAIVSRWDLSDGKKIVVYIDTLFSAVQREAVSRGILAWNKPFQAAGLGTATARRAAWRFPPFPTRPPAWYRPAALPCPPDFGPMPGWTACSAFPMWIPVGTSMKSPKMPSARSSRPRSCRPSRVCWAWAPMRPAHTPIRPSSCGTRPLPGSMDLPHP